MYLDHVEILNSSGFEPAFSNKKLTLCFRNSNTVANDVLNWPAVILLVSFGRLSPSACSKNLKRGRYVTLKTSFCFFVARHLVDSFRKGLTLAPSFTIAPYNHKCQPARRSIWVGKTKSLGANQYLPSNAYMMIVFCCTGGWTPSGRRPWLMVTPEFLSWLIRSSTALISLFSKSPSIVFSRSPVIFPDASALSSIAVFTASINCCGIFFTSVSVSRHVSRRRRSFDACLTVGGMPVAYSKIPGVGSVVTRAFSRSSCASL